MTEAKFFFLRLQALANPVGPWIIFMSYRNGAQYASKLARMAGISRPLLKMHLSKLQSAGLVTSEIGTAANGNPANVFKAVPFDIPLNLENTAERGRGRFTGHQENWRRQCLKAQANSCQ